MSDEITEKQIDMEAQHVRKTGLTRYEACWDDLWDIMCKKRKTSHGGGWPSIVLDIMTEIENRVIGPTNEEE